MLNHTYTSVKNANVVDCGKKKPIPSQPFPLLRDNYLGEYRTELDKKKVLANLGIATDLSLEWEFIKGDIGRSVALMGELDSRTKYISAIDGFTKTIIDGILYLESVVGGEQEGEEEQNERLTNLETASKELSDKLTELKTYLEETIEVDVDTLEESLTNITEKVNNITDLIQVSSKTGNALSLLTIEDVEEGETPGLYVPDLSEDVNIATENIGKLQEEVKNINESLDDFVTREELGGGDFDFVNQNDFDNYKESTNSKLDSIETELDKTVKTGEDGHVDTLYVNTISKDNDEGNIVITDSFEVDSNIPLDIRFVRETLDDLYALPVKVCYPGMGVIVNALSSLYILRKPAEGVVFNQEYIADPNNWKCPEDLVTVAMTRQEYEDLKEEEINPNVFYYIYEDEITRTKEPKRESYNTEEEFLIEWEKWVNSLKTLSQEYMSASWGIEIENKLGEKASSQSVSLLAEEISNIKGGQNGLSLESLSNSIQELQSKDESLKIDDYSNDHSVFKEQLSNQFTTKELISETLSLNNKLIKVEENRLNYDSKKLAHLDEVPNIQVLSLKEYGDLEEVSETTYYYTYDDEESLVTKTDLSKEIKRLQDQINLLATTNSELSTRISILEETLSSIQS